MLEKLDKESSLYRTVSEALSCAYVLKLTPFGMASGNCIIPVCHRNSRGGEMEEKPERSDKFFKILFGKCGGNL